MKNKYSLIKKFTIAGLAFSTMSFAFADPLSNVAPQAAAGASGVDSSMIVAAINDLNHNIQKLAYAKAMSKNADNYQDSASLAQAAQVNTQKNQAQLQEYPGAQGVNAIGQQKAAQRTEGQNKNELSQFADSALTYNAVSSDVSAALARNKKRQDAINAYSWETKASDTLYTDLATASPELQKPTDLHNNYFNFSNLIQPTTYTPVQENAAKHFITYLSQQFQSLSSNIDFGKLRTYLLTLQNNPEKLNDVLKSFVTSSSYEQYQLASREVIAERSVALNNLNELATERSPITTTQPNAELDQLSKAIGVTPSTQKDAKSGQTVYVYASPLQISNFVTTHRTSSPQWYQQMMAASPATVKRETLFVMAEMEAEMQRQHLDNERILATLSATQMQNVTGQLNSLKAMSNDINQQIANLTNSGNKSAVQPLNGPGAPTTMSPAQ